MALASAAVAWALWPVPVLRLRNETTHAELACVAARDGAPLELTYVHSIYRQRATEEFVVRPDGLDLVRLRSASVPVLEYYARPEPIRPSAGDFSIEVPPERHAVLPVLVSALGERTVHYDGRVWALPQLAADGDRIRLAVERAPQLCTIWPHRLPTT